MCSGVLVNPFRAPKPLPILNLSNFVPKNGFPVVKGLRIFWTTTALREHHAAFCGLYKPFTKSV